MPSIKQTGKIVAVASEVAYFLVVVMTICLMIAYMILVENSQRKVNINYEPETVETK